MPLTKADKEHILEEIRLKHPRQVLRAHDVVEAAKAPTHPLHQHFEWNNTKAAAAYRLVQARNLIRSITVIRPAEDRPVMRPIYFSLDSDRIQHGGGYQRIETIMASDALQEEMHSAALRDLQAWARRYRTIERLTSPTVARFEQLLGAERTPMLAAAD